MKIEQIYESLTQTDGDEFAERADAVLRRLNLPAQLTAGVAGPFGDCQAIAVERNPAGEPARAIVWDGTNDSDPWRLVDIEDSQHANFLGIDRAQ